uniref:hypothetical protein n=1 Tax=Paracoccus sp. TRP TaxID=412597 RepID=UPI000225F65C|nr:hypothetical protein [Paracoccus sp. TRP]
MTDMTRTPPTFLQEIEAFLAETGMGESYFGKRAAGNSELVSRLRGNGRVWPETEAKVRSFISAVRTNLRNSGHVNATPSRQPRPRQGKGGVA